jgi:perosamine synthetase
VDVESYSFNLSIEQVELSIKSKTKGILAVHLFGYCTKMDAVIDIAHCQNLFVIEDTAPKHWEPVISSLMAVNKKMGP